MKLKPTSLFTGLLVISFYGCKKTGNTPTSITGKWNIEKTVYHYAKDTTINGLATDYYNFAAGGVLTIQDHADSYTGKYSMYGKDTVGILTYTVDGHGTGVATPPFKFSISYSTNNNAVLISQPIPSGQTIIYLRKED